MSVETPDNGDYDEKIPGLDEMPSTSEVDKPAVDEIVAPPQNKSKVIPNEFINIKNKDRILPYVISQPVKKNHFMFKNEKDQENLGNILAPNDSGFTAVFSTTKDKPHIMLKIGEKVEGKIHFLYYDGNKVNEKHIKIYLFDFTDSTVHSDIKSKLINFFENFTPAVPAAINSNPQQQQGGKKKRRNTKKRRVVKKYAKRKTNRRR
jgi:hypothetical protein